MIVGKKIRVRGLVQGVGFRPTVWNIANKQKLHGQVINDGEGVLIEVFGSQNQIKEFVSTLKQDCPPLARIDGIEEEDLKGKSPVGFTIKSSKSSSVQTGIVPDAATCEVCSNETLDINNRRFRYPFSNCTHCGPRLTIIKSIPYDRKNTSMAPFKLCDDCQQEYDYPADRRFHAQPNACSKCGPKIWLEPNVNDEDTITATIKLLKQGKIIAIKGLGGFHLVCDATNQQVVQTLRKRKNRQAKPFALMARSVQNIKKYCQINAAEKKLLSSSISPIVLLSKKHSNLPKELAPNQNTLGFMLPYTPLHHLIFQAFETPLVMTSGNSSDSPQCIDNDEAKQTLADIADYWLLNNRDVVNRVDDSVVRVLNDGNTQVLRRARGYAPTTIPLPKGFAQNTDVLATGAELKNTFCLVKDGVAFLSQHIGDLKNANTYADYEKTLLLYQNLYQHKPKVIAIDAHPDYLSSKYGQNLAQQNDLKLIKVQHHHAHIASTLAENKWGLNQGKVLGVALDGIGYGDDDAIWGGEFLLADYQSYQRIGRLKPIALLGGSQAMYQPWRNTLAQLLSHFDWQELQASYSNLDIIKYLNQQPIPTLKAMLTKNINSPEASSCGRLFDAVAAAIGICCEHVQYEGQAAIELEALVSNTLLQQEKKGAYKLKVEETDSKLLQINTQTLWHTLLEDLSNQVPKNIIATRFHMGLANVIVEMIGIINICNTKIDTIALTGGVFQNKIILEYTKAQLIKEKYKVLTHSQIPANDGGIALGQALIALAQCQLEEKNSCV